MRQKPNTLRRAVAAVEFAFVVPLLFLLLLGIWELGRIIHVEQVMQAAVRDGARLAAQASTVATNGAYTQIDRETAFAAIKNALIGNGLSNLDGATFEFTFLDGSPAREPHQGKKNERFRIRVALPYDNVRWTNLSLFNPKTLVVEVNWQMLTDDPFTLNTTLPGWTYP